MQIEDPQSDEGREPTSEEIAQMRKATPVEAAAVDALILQYCINRWRKVAMIVGRASSEFESRFPHLPYIYMQVRMLELDAAGLLEIQGDVMAMRASEVRLVKKVG